MSLKVFVGRPRRTVFFLILCFESPLELEVFILGNLTWKKFHTNRDEWPFKPFIVMPKAVPLH
jgi:hypothetical protein